MIGLHLHPWHLLLNLLNLQHLQLYGLISHLQWEVLLIGLHLILLWQELHLEWCLLPLKRVPNVKYILYDFPCYSSIFKILNYVIDCMLKSVVALISSILWSVPFTHSLLLFQLTGVSSNNHMLYVYFCLVWRSLSMLIQYFCLHSLPLGICFLTL